MTSKNMTSKNKKTSEGYTTTQAIEIAKVMYLNEMDAGMDSITAQSSVNAMLTKLNINARVVIDESFYLADGAALIFSNPTITT